MALIKAPKARNAADCVRLEQLPNIGPAIAADLRAIGIAEPRDLVGRDAYALYRTLCTETGPRHDPCVLDTFMAATDFTSGADPSPWWHYTSERKRLFGAL
jgi:Pathogenicity locus